MIIPSCWLLIWLFTVINTVVACGDRLGGSRNNPYERDFFNLLFNDTVCFLAAVDRARRLLHHASKEQRESREKGVDIHRAINVYKNVYKNVCKNVYKNVYKNVCKKYVKGTLQYRKRDSSFGRIFRRQFLCFFHRNFFYLPYDQSF